MEFEKVYLYAPLHDESFNLPTEYVVSSTGGTIEMLLEELTEKYFASNCGVDFSIILLFFNELALSDNGQDALGDSFSLKLIVSELKCDFKHFYLNLLKDNVEHNLLKLDDETLTRLKKCSDIVEKTFLFILRNCLISYPKIDNEKMTGLQSELFKEIQNFLRKQIDEELLRAYVGIMRELYNHFEKRVLLKCKYSEEDVAEKEENIGLEKSLEFLANCVSFKEN